MEVILRQAVEALGHPGDIVKVSAGYARNYLLPRGLLRGDAGKPESARAGGSASSRQRSSAALSARLATRRAVYSLFFRRASGRASIRLSDRIDIEHQLEGQGFSLEKRKSSGTTLFARGSKYHQLHAT